MGENLLQDTIFCHREDLMVSPTGGIPTLRAAHFLKPTCDSVSGPALKPLPVSLSSGSKPPLKVAFNGWRRPQSKWVQWIKNMQAKYSHVWKEAGIHDAILCSTFSGQRDDDLIFGLAEKWCPETNTFLFSWGEATITLEDMMILGGFSVLGAPVSLPLETKELMEVREKLEKARKEQQKGLNQRARFADWLQSFMGSGSDVEHEAFLSLWLSRYIFPGIQQINRISNHVFPIAIHLARGTRIAIAPSVLASIYRDLSLIKGTMISSSSDSQDTDFILTLRAPFAFVQTWAWERIPELQPTPNRLDFGQLRLARWHKVKRLKLDKNVRCVIDSAGESFLWRPYAIVTDKWVFPKFYKENEEWISCDLGLDENFESLARCLRVSELVSLDCKEPYFPNRVAMQFGMDQDVPGWIPQSVLSPEDAWINYCRPVSDEKLYIPCRMFEPDVTFRYLNWWKSLWMPQVPINIVKKKRSSRKWKRLQRVLDANNEGNEAKDLHEKVTETCAELGENSNPLLDSELGGISHLKPANGLLTEFNSLESPFQMSLQGEAAKRATEVASKFMSSDVEAENEVEDVPRCNGEDESSDTLEAITKRLNLEDRISKLEREMAAIKAERFNCKPK